MGIAIRSRWQIFHPEFGYCSRLRTEIGDVDNDKFLGLFRVEQRKNKVRASKTCIYYCYIVGKREILHLFNHSRTKAIIGKQGVSASCYYDLWIQHRGYSHWMSF